MSNLTEYPPLLKVTGSFLACKACLDGKGGECHTPGCVFWMNRAPDLPLRANLEDHGCVIDREIDSPCLDELIAGVGRYCPECKEKLGRPHREGCNWDPITGPPSLGSDPKEPEEFPDCESVGMKHHVYIMPGSTKAICKRCGKPDPDKEQG